MGALTDSLTAVATALGTAGIATVIKGFSTATPPTGTHCVLSVEASPLQRVDVDGYEGTTAVLVDWFTPGNAADGQTEYLAALDAWDTLVRSLTLNLDRTCSGIDPSDGVDRQEESADLPHWYAGSLSVTFMRREYNSV
jgi:hypothetical protein